MNDNFLSICIPAYKRTDFLKRLLNSIALQTFTNFEVVVCDDSPDNKVEELCLQYVDQFPLVYHRNPFALGTPENWNEAIKNAKGRWIKIVHDDDWFSSKDSLEKFALAVKNNPQCSFFFCAYSNVYEDTNKVKPMYLKQMWYWALLKNANILIADNVIGPPSVILHKNDQKVWYDSAMKYVVDIDFYIRYLEKAKSFYISDSLINVGINSAQVTKYTYNVAEVHLKESLCLLEKTGEKQLKNILVFDGWWRLIRNFKMRSIDEIRSTGYKGVIPLTIIRIMKFQEKLPDALLKIGPFSKLVMGVCYSFNVVKIR